LTFVGFLSPNVKYQNHECDSFLGGNIVLKKTFLIIKIIPFSILGEELVLPLSFVFVSCLYQVIADQSESYSLFF
jgi:hypothetical protein